MVTFFAKIIQLLKVANVYKLQGYLKYTKGVY